MENIAWGFPNTTTSAPMRFLQFAKLVHAEPQLNLNEGSGTPQEAVGWVHYVRERYQGPMILEIGNELYGHWQVGFPTLDELAARTHTFTDALKPFSKDVTLMVTGDTPNNFEKWNAQLLTLAPKQLRPDHNPFHHRHQPCEAPALHA